MKLYKDYDSFSERIGILSEEELKSLGWKCDNGNRIGPSLLEELVGFRDNLNLKSRQFITEKKYHIATEVDAADLEDEYRTLNSLGEDVNVATTCITNRIAYVNRMDYYLCNGDDDEEIFLEEVEEL